ncbi:methyltransferase domain-containing protein [Paraburkholderia sp. RL17-383-BIF-A]|uniref:methyltransferase domain-containing protein n=1 Tax=Paraburkholderia sp. RL17-383-BIF-A TaxID=3031631 RepID=UPI0038BBC7DD
MGGEKREKLLSGLDVSTLVGVEIGALDKPYIRREDGNVIYVDYTDRETLVGKYKNDPHVDVDNIVHVDAIWGENTLADAVNHRKVDYVVASHVIEHVPDLITWLGELRSILKDTGEVRLIIPDRRFTFDYLREETRFADILNSHLVRARVPQPHSALDFLLNAATVDCGAAWDGNIEAENLEKFHKFDGAVKIARDILENGTYHDVHCWVFTPKSFARLMGQMADVGMVDFACERFYDTAKYTFEFFVSLRPCADRAQIIKSWKRMEDEAVASSPGSSVEQQSGLAQKALRGQAELIKQLDAELASSRLKIIEMTEKVRNVAKAATEMRSTVDDLNARLAHAQRRITSIENSTSWRMTEPVRSIVMLIRRLISH